MPNDVKQRKSSKKLPKSPNPKQPKSILKPGITCEERERRQQLRNVYLTHKTFGKCRIKAARYTSTLRNLFLCDTSTGEKQLIADAEYWNEAPATLADVFERFEADSPRIEKLLAAAENETEKQRAAEMESAKTAVSPVSPDVHQPDISDLQRRERRLDLSSFEPDDLLSNRHNVSP